MRVWGNLAIQGHLQGKTSMTDLIKKYKKLAREHGHFRTVSQTGFSLHCTDCHADIFLDNLDKNGGPVIGCGENPSFFQEHRSGWEDSNEQTKRRKKGLCDIGQYVDENGYWRTNNPG